MAEKLILNGPVTRVRTGKLLTFSVDGAYAQVTYAEHLRSDTGIIKNTALTASYTRTLDEMMAIPEFASAWNTLQSFLEFEDPQNPDAED